MPAIDLARLRKQAHRVADFFFLPEDFLKYLREMLEFYVNHSMRTKENIAPGSNLPTYRTPVVVMRQIQNEVNLLAQENPQAALELADLLWDEGYLETRLLAAFLLGHIPPKEERLLARLTAWTQQVRDPDVRAALLTTSLARMRTEIPDEFFALVGEWLHPARQRLWPNGILALIPILSDPNFENLPRVLEIAKPIIEAAPGAIQSEIAALIAALYDASKTETTFYLREILENSDNPMTVVTLRRVLPSLPTDLQVTLREYVRPQRKT